MPKKTRSQKIAAERRKHTTPHIHTTPRVMTEKKEVKTTKIEITEKNQQKKIISVTSEYFRHDLSKSILISSIIFLLEAGLYLAQQYGFINVIKLLPF